MTSIPLEAFQIISGQFIVQMFTSLIDPQEPNVAKLHSIYKVNNQIERAVINNKFMNFLKKNII